MTALLAPALYPEDPLSMVAAPFLWPGEQSGLPLGSDALGRDVLAGILYGGRVSLLVGIASAGVALAVGILVGALAGYCGGGIDRVLIHLVEIVQTPPSFVLLTVIVAIAQPTTTSIVLAIGLTTSPQIARLARAQFRSIREMDYVLAARGVGCGHLRIVLRGILPNAMPPIVATSSVLMASAVLMEAALSFMGLGDPNVVSWGSMIGAGREVLRDAWYLTALPGLAVILTVLSLNLIGDGLNDALDPRLGIRR